jgi:hypothetical protein
MRTMDMQDLIAEVRSLFDPVAARLGLGSGVATRSRHSDFSVVYLGSPIGLQIEVEAAEPFIGALAFRPRDGACPVGYEDDSGRRQKMYIQTAAQVLGQNLTAQNATIRKIESDRRNPQRIVQVAQLLAPMTERLWSLLVAGHTKLFPS